SGTVTDLFNVGIPGVTIHAKLRASSLFTGQTDFFAVTGQDGTYRIDRASTGTYDVFVDQPFPAAFNNPQPTSQTVFVNSAQETRGVDFTMTGLPAALDVTVFEVANNQKVGPLPGITVQLLQNGQPLQGFSGTTDANGAVHFNDVPPGPTTAQATDPNGVFI